jgi:hypothetical protein
MMKCTHYKIHLSKFKAGFEPIYTADEFVHIYDFEDTCNELTELDILNLILKKKVHLTMMIYNILK